MVEGTGCTGSSDKWCLPAAAADGADPSHPASVSRLLPFSIRQIIITFLPFLINFMPLPAAVVTVLTADQFGQITVHGF